MPSQVTIVHYMLQFVWALVKPIVERINRGTNTYDLRPPLHSMASQLVLQFLQLDASSLTAAAAAAGVNRLP